MLSFKDTHLTSNTENLLHILKKQFIIYKKPSPTPPMKTKSKCSSTILSTTRRVQLSLTRSPNESGSKTRDRLLKATWDGSRPTSIQQMNEPITKVGWLLLTNPSQRNSKSWLLTLNLLFLCCLGQDTWRKTLSSPLISQL